MKKVFLFSLVVLLSCKINAEFSEKNEAEKQKYREELSQFPPNESVPERMFTTSVKEPIVTISIPTMPDDAYYNVGEPNSDAYGDRNVDRRGNLIVNIPLKKSPTITLPVKKEKTAISFNNSQKKDCINKNKEYAKIKSSYLKVYNNFMKKKYYGVGCSVDKVYSVKPAGINCQSIVAKAVEEATKSVPGYITANPVLNKSLCVGGVCGLNGCVQAQYGNAN